MPHARGRTPGGVRRCQPLDQIGVDTVAALCQGLADIPLRQVERAPQPWADPNRQRLQRVQRACAGEQEALRPALTQPQRQRADRFDRPFAALALGIGQQGRQRLARQHRLFACLQRSKAGGQTRLDRKRGEQALAEPMDRLNAQAATRRIEHACKQRARPRLQVRRALLAQRFQIGVQLRCRHPHPGGEPVVDPLRHFGRARLGEGQAQDRRRIGAAQQQAKHARGEHLRLSRAGRCGQPDVRVRIARRRLRALQPRQGRQLSPGHTIRPGASVGHIPHKAHIRAPASR